MSALLKGSKYQYELANELGILDTTVRIVGADLVNIGYLRSRKEGRKIFYCLSSRGRKIAKACDQLCL